MRVLILSATEDTGGVGFSLAKALNQHTAWEAREVHRTPNYIDYPADILWPPDVEPMPDGLRSLFEAADVIHVMQSWKAVDPFEGWQDKPLVIHHHGSHFRANHAALTKTTRELHATPIVSTLDLTLLAPEAEWLPNPIDVDRMLDIRETEWPVVPDDDHPAMFTVAHSPTNRTTKGTDIFLAAASRVPGIRVDLIEKQTWATSLIRKARADVVYDQMRSGYGLAGLEAMAMGIPVIAGAKDPTLMGMGIPGGAHLVELFARVLGYLPFLCADDEASLEQRLRDLQCDAALRQQLAVLGEYHARRWHGEARVAQQLAGIYERALR